MKINEASEMLWCLQEFSFFEIQVGVGGEARAEV